MNTSPVGPWLRFAITAALALGPLAPEAAQAQPRLEMESKTLRLGAVKRGESASATFTVRNGGNAPLTVVLESASCDCMEVAAPPAIAAGAEGKVVVTIDTRGLDGPNELFVLMRTSDPERSSERWVIQVVVESPIAVSPGSARYIYVQHEVPGVIQQTLWSTDGTDFRVREVESPYKYLSAEFHEAAAAERSADKPGKQWIITTTLQPDASVGALQGHIRVRTDHPVQKELLIPLSGFVRPVFVATPAEVDFGQVVADQASRLLVRIANYATEPIAVGVDSVSGEGIEARLRTVTEGRRYELEVFLKARNPGAASGIVVLTTTSPKVPRIEVPVRYVAVQGGS